MAKQVFKVDIDLEQNELLQAKVQNAGTAPTTPVVGQIYYDTSINKMGIYTSTGWMYFVAGSSGGSGYLDDITSTQTAIDVNISGTVATITIANATQTDDGLMSKEDKTKLDNATSADTASTLVERDGSGVISVSQITITGGTPTNPTDAATKGYVDGLVQGLKTKLPARAISTSNITLNGPQTIDGVAVDANDRVLVAGQSDPKDNGIYIVQTGAWTRADDLPAGSAAANIYLFIEEGDDNADTGWVCTNNTGSDEVDEDGLTFVKFSSAGVIEAGQGLTKTGNMLNVGANADGSITVNQDDIQVNRDPNGGIGVSASGIAVTPKTNGGIDVDGDGVSVVGDNARAVTVGPNGVGVDVEGTDVVISGNQIALGNRVTKTVYSDVSLTAGTASTITHNLNTQNVNVIVINPTSGEQYFMNITRPTVNTVTVTSNSAENVRVIISGAVGASV